MEDDNGAIMMHNQFVILKTCMNKLQCEATEATSRSFCKSTEIENSNTRFQSYSTSFYPLNPFKFATAVRKIVASANCTILTMKWNNFVIEVSLYVRDICVGIIKYLRRRNKMLPYNFEIVY